MSTTSSTLSGNKNTPEGDSSSPGKKQGSVPQVGDIVLFKNEPISQLPDLLSRKNRDIFGSTTNYQREVGGCSITVTIHL